MPELLDEGMGADVVEVGVVGVHHAHGHAAPPRDRAVDEAHAVRGVDVHDGIVPRSQNAGELAGPMDHLLEDVRPRLGKAHEVAAAQPLDRSVVGVVPLADAEYVKVHPSLAEGLGLQDAENDRLYSAGTPALRIEQHPFASHVPLQPRRTVVQYPTSNSDGLRELRT